MKFSVSILTLTGLAVLTLMPIAQAQELVTNGGFETGDITGWTVPSSGNHVSATASYVHAGNFGLEYGAAGFDSPLSQTLNTTIGDTETITFWQHQSSGIPNEVALDFGGVRLLTLTDLPPGSWNQYTATATATSSATVLTFGLRDDLDFSGIDDISVIQSAPNNVPEPGTVALLGSLGLAGAGFLRRKRTLS